MKNRQSSSCVASAGTFPAHMTHSERCAGGLGWYGLRAVDDGLPDPAPAPVRLMIDGAEPASDRAGSLIDLAIDRGGGGGSGAGEGGVVNEGSGG